MNDDDNIARAQTGVVYRTRFANNPLAALVETGVDVPAGVTIDIKDDIVDAQHIVLSAAPAAYGYVVLDDADSAAGGTIISRGLN